VESALNDPQAARIVEELASGLELELKEREEELGRELTEDEVVARLKSEKNPLVVAEEQGPKKSLIGPLLYPGYLRILKWIGLVSLTWLALWVGLVILVPSFRLKHPGLQLLGTLRPIWDFALFGFAFSTAIIGMLSRYQEKLKVAWDPRKLPALRNEAVILRRYSFLGLTISSLCLLWWLDILQVPIFSGWHLSLAPQVSRPFYWPFSLLLLALIAVDAGALLWPLRTKRSVGCRWCVDVVGFIVLLALLGKGIQFHTVVNVQASTLALPDQESAGWLMTIALLAATLVADVFFAFRIFQDGRWLLGKGPDRFRSWTSF
jgi:hypothetical protein